MNRHRVGRALQLGAAAILALAAADARAEGFFDVYAGGAITVNSRLEERVETIAATVTSAPKTSYQNSIAGGVRGGYWIDPLPWIGVAGDVSAFSTTEDVQEKPTEITIIPLSLLVMLRAPLLKSDTMPHGRLQPYVAAGPSFFLSQAETDRVVIDGVDVSALGFGGFEDTSTDLGLDVRAGLKVIAAENFGIFVEYRFTKFDPRYQDSAILTGFANLDSEVTINPSRIDTHHVSIGLSFTF